MGRGSGSGNGTVTLYHRTSTAAAAQSIAANGFKPTFAKGLNQSYKSYNSKYGFFTKGKSGQEGYGNHIVKVTVSKSAVQKDPGSGHYRVPISKLTGAKFTYVNPT